MIILLTVFCLLLITALVFVPKDIKSKEAVYFFAEKGQGSTVISNRLEEEGLIISDRVFQFYIFVRGISSKLQAGTYELSKSMSISQIAEKLFRGDIAKDRITIVEGWSLKDIADYLEERELYKKEDIFALTGEPLNNPVNPKDFSSEFDFLEDKPKNLNLEGYLFPDTYELKKGATGQELVAKTLNNFDKKLTSELRQEISRQDRTIFEIITIASLIEKEIKTPADKKIVSGVIQNRLKNNMALNIDATLTYILGKNSTKISINETKIDSPYNTYKYRGLPLGPICNPGIESILAAVYPTQTDYFYYLSAPDGKTIFSRTLEEHNIAKEKYLK